MVTSGASCACDSCPPDLEAEFARWQRIAREGHLAARRAARAEHLALQPPRRRSDTAFDLDAADAFDPSGGLRRALAGRRPGSLGAGSSRRSGGGSTGPTVILDGVVVSDTWWPSRLPELPRLDPFDRSPGGDDTPDPDWPFLIPFPIPWDPPPWLPATLAQCPLPYTEEEFDFTAVPYPSNLVDDSGRVIDHWVFTPEGEPRAEMILLLHGMGGEASHVAAIARNFARAGFRTIALTWSSLTTAVVCTAEAGGALWTDEQWNDCVEEERERKNWDPLVGIVPNLTSLLNKLVAQDWAWAAYLTRDRTAPKWANIIHAGYSSGANHTAYNIRQFPVPGAIFISGGGDLGSQPPQAPGDPLADYMTQVAENENFVGLRHLDENYDYTAGWDLNGLPATVADAAPTGGFYGAFSDANRLEHDKQFPRVTDPEVKKDLAHASTILAELRPAHMYLACKAATR